MYSKKTAEVLSGEGRTQSVDLAIEKEPVAPWTIMSLKGATSLCRLVGSAAMNPGTKKCPSRSASHHTEGVILAAVVNGVALPRPVSK